MAWQITILDLFFTGKYFFHDVTAAILMFPNNKIFSFILLVFFYGNISYIAWEHLHGYHEHAI